MDVYRPKKDPRPCRRKDKDNPYEIFSVGIDTDTPHFYVSFKDGQGVQICMEIDKAVFDLLDRFELDDLSFLNEWDRHMPDRRQRIKVDRSKCRINAERRKRDETDRSAPPAAQ